MEFSEVLGSVRLDVVLVACLVSIAFIVKAFNNRKNLPPGPYGLPILGYIPMLIRKPHEELLNLGRRYGDIYSIQFGSETFVVLNSGKAVREVLSKSEVFDRPEQSRYLVAPCKDPYFGNGQPWKEHKKFALKVFRELNAGKALEKQINVEVNKLIGNLQSQAGKPTDIRPELVSRIVDVTTAVNFGHGFDVKGRKRDADKHVAGVLESLESSLIFIAFPWMKNNSLLKKILKFDHVLKKFYDGVAFLRDIYVEQKKRPAESRPNSLSASLMDEMEKPDSNKEIFNDEVAVDGIAVLYGAGMETVKAALVWAFYTMGVYKDVQRKVHKEIDAVLGKDTIPSYSDQKEMRYTQAVIMEILRWKTIVPVGIRNVTADTNIAGYDVPKDMIVLINVHGIHRDPRCWEDPDEFKPERFLSPDGKHILKHDNYMPFSYGKRSCLGEGIAWMEMFLFFAGVLQKFEIDLPEGDKPNFDGFGALSYQMKYHRLCFRPRHS